MNRLPIYSIGYSNHLPDVFVELLRGHGVTAVADVRSSPYSRRRYYCRQPLAELLADEGIEYVFLGEQLGARRDEAECYVDDQAVYERVAKLPQFVAGIERLLTGAEKYRIAMMCGERDPLDCHRGVLITPALVDAGAEVQHILADRSLEHHTETEQRLIDLLGLDPLFDGALDRASLLARAYAERGRQLAYRREPES